MADAVISIRGLTVDLPRGADRPHAVDGIDLDIGRHEIVCIVGESGSGKSVTAHAVMGLLPRGVTARAGRILFGATDLLQLSPAGMRALRGREIAMIFQDPMAALNPVVAIGKQITEQITAHRRMPAHAAMAPATDLLGQMGLPD